MLGKPSRHSQERLEQNGRRAIAIVLAVAKHGMAVTHGAESVVSNTDLAVKLTLRVEPDGEPAFEVQARFRFSQFSPPTQGKQLAVIYDPNDHDSIMLDDSPAAQVKLKMLAMGKSKEQIDLMQRLIASTPGTTTADAQAVAAQYAELNGEMMSTPGAVDAGASPAPDITQKDPVELLSQLVAMKDRGLLSEAEFAEQKSRILGG